MSAHNNWRQIIDMPDWMRDSEKRLMHQERRPQSSTAADLLGPGAAPRAVRIEDWNDQVTTFTGAFYSEPGETNAPDTTSYWMGETFGTPDGYGFQRLTRYRLEPPTTGSWGVQVRRWRPVSGLPVFDPWEAA